jgi:hypothetical protein
MRLIVPQFRMQDYLNYLAFGIWKRNQTISLAARIGPAHVPSHESSPYLLFRPATTTRRRLPALADLLNPRDNSKQF